MKYLFIPLFIVALFVSQAFAQSESAINTAVTLVQPSGSPQIEEPIASVARGLVDKNGKVILNAVDTSLKLYNSTNAFVYTLSLPVPAANVTAGFPAAGGFAITSATDLQGAHAIWGGNSSFIFEGATANGFETTVAIADPTVDTTQTVPAAVVSGTVEVLSVQAESATDTITAGQLYGGLITNTGAVGAAVYTLPAPVVGMHFRVYLTVAQDVDINPADGTQILALTNATGDAISSAATIGNCIELIAVSTTEWVALAVSGAWADSN